MTKIVENKENVKQLRRYNYFMISASILYLFIFIVPFFYILKCCNLLLFLIFPV